MAVGSCSLYVFSPKRDAGQHCMCGLTSITGSIPVVRHDVSHAAEAVAGLAIFSSSFKKRSLRESETEILGSEPIEQRFCTTARAADAAEVVVLLLVLVSFGRHGFYISATAIMHMESPYGKSTEVTALQCDVHTMLRFVNSLMAKDLSTVEQGRVTCV